MFHSCTNHKIVKWLIRQDNIIIRANHYCITWIMFCSHWLPLSRSWFCFQMFVYPAHHIFVHFSPTYDTAAIQQQLRVWCSLKWFKSSKISLLSLNTTACRKCEGTNAVHSGPWHQRVIWSLEFRSCYRTDRVPAIVLSILHRTPLGVLQDHDTVWWG